VHSITRIPNNPTENVDGGDYGLFASTFQSGPATLMEHYLLNDHHANSKLNFDYKLSNAYKNMIISKSHGHSHSHDHSHSHEG